MVERATQRYRVEVFNAQGRFQSQSFVLAESGLEAAKKAQPLLPTFYDREDGPYVLVSPSPHRPSDGVCTRCGSPRYRCGGESNPHE